MNVLFSASKHIRRLFLCCLLLVGLLRPGLVLADSASFVKRLDPTDFRTRLELRDKIQEPQFGGLRNIVLPKIDYAFSKTFALRIELPMATWDTGRSGLDAQTGMGDVSIRAALRLLRTPGFALVAGVEGILDTASDSLLGYGRNVVAPFMFMSFDAPTLHSTIFPNLQHFHAVDGDSNLAQVNYTQGKLFVLTRWPNRFYTGTEALVIVDHVRNNRMGATLEVEAGRFLDQHVAVWVRPGVGLAGDDIPQIYNWNVEVGLRYLFD